MKDWKASLHLVEARYALTSGLRGDQVEMEGLGGLGLKPACRHVFWFGPHNRVRVRCGWIAVTEAT